MSAYQSVWSSISEVHLLLARRSREQIGDLVLDPCIPLFLKEFLVFEPRHHTPVILHPMG